jgi:hypothetical protein
MAWSLSDKLVLVDITVQTFALIAGILALLIVAGVLIL